MKKGGSEKQRMMQGAIGDEDGVNHCSRSQKRPPSSSLRKRMKNVKEAAEHPSDLLDKISNKLDIDDLFSFGKVCSSWRLFHSTFWGNFMASQAPMVFQKTPKAKRACAFFSLSDGRKYHTLLPSFCGFSHIGISNGYLIMVGGMNKLLLTNPFSRKQMKIKGPPIQGSVMEMYDRAMLAFYENSEEFIIVALCKRANKMDVYQSRNSSWTIFPKMLCPLGVMDTVVHDQTLYAITDDWRIAVVKLDSPILGFIGLRREQFRMFCTNLRLVSSDNQLLVVYFKPLEYLEVHRVHFSTMRIVQLETLGDRSLFLSATRCTSLSNPGMLGLDNNCLYYIDRMSPTCQVFSMENQLIRTIALPEICPPLKDKLCNMDWCFRHLRDEIKFENHLRKEIKREIMNE